VVQMYSGDNFATHFVRSETIAISWWLVIGTPANISLWSLTAWSGYVYTFSDYFWIEDLRWNNTGHYTTIQCDGLYGPNNAIITGVQMSGSLIEKIVWITNNTLIYSSLTTWTDITEPQLYLYRNDIIGANGAINRYWNKPSIKITVPADVPSGSYKWKITYTLYDIPFSY
jgi:hypothetical protein